MDLGPTKFRRWVLDHIPHAKIQEMKDIVDTMDRQSREIFESKKTLLEKGDEAVSRQIGEGKDILSIMSERHSPLIALCDSFSSRQCERTWMPQRTIDCLRMSSSRK